MVLGWEGLGLVEGLDLGVVVEGLRRTGLGIV